MPALVLVAHDDTATRELAVAALNAAGVTAVGFHDPMAALDAIEGDSLVRVLVTRVDFGAGKLNGVALARMVRVKRPSLKVLFLALQENRKHAEAMGEFLPMPIDPYLLVDAVGRLLKSRRTEWRRSTYRRGDLFEKRRRLMSEWVKFCGRVAPVTGNVVAMWAETRHRQRVVALPLTSDRGRSRTRTM
jgi:DNA-binding NtrC family response regulator